MIPKIIHLLWMQGINTMPTHYLGYCQSWERKHPKWEVRSWTFDDLPTLQNEWVLDIDDPTLQSDVARFELVLQYGGVYVDCDMECLQALDPLIKDCDAFISKRTRDMLASSSFGAVKGSQWLDEIVQEILWRKDDIMAPGTIRGPIERVTRKHPEVRRLHRGLLEAGTPQPGAYAVHHRQCLWNKPVQREQAE